MAEKKTEVATVKVQAEQVAKPGYKSTEFWLSAVAAIVGLLIASGVLKDGSMAAQITGIVATALVALGYTTNRTKAKAK